MPWERISVEELREAFISEVKQGEEGKSALCRKYGISRPTGDKWLKRYFAEQGLSDRSRAPLNTPGKTPAQIETAILEFRSQHPGLGAKKIKRILENRGLLMPSATTVNNILKRNGCISVADSMANHKHIRFQMERPNDLWQADFKGHFAMNNGQRCHILNVLDDHSRFVLCSDANDSEKFAPTKRSFERIFHGFGLPFRLLCDNGNPWGTSQSTGYTSFEVWLMELGVQPVHGRILHPQTQGKQERFNGSLQRELLRFEVFQDLPDVQAKLDIYRHFYNHERPHEALNMRTPAELYEPGSRPCPRIIRPWEYDAGVVRKVKSSGYLTFASQGFFLSEALANKVVCILPSPDTDGLFDVRFRQFRIAQIDLRERCLVSKRIRNV